jgi:chromosome segregation ATPase
MIVGRDSYPAGQYEKLLESSFSKDLDADSCHAISEEVARKLEERRRVVQEKLAQREERRKELEEKLSANKAVKMGRELIATHNWFSKEHRQREQAIVEREEESHKRMQEQNSDLSARLGPMIARANAHNQVTAEIEEAHQAREASLEAEKERLRLEKEAKKQKEAQFWEIQEAYRAKAAALQAKLERLKAEKEAKKQNDA